VDALQLEHGWAASRCKSQTNETGLADRAESLSQTNVLDLIDIIAGARLNSMKIAPIISTVEARMPADALPTHRVLHNGQH